MKKTKNPMKPKAVLRSPLSIEDGRNGRDGRFGRFAGEQAGQAGEDGSDILSIVFLFLKKYIVLSEAELRVVSAWVVAAWLADLWDRFPHLAITSPVNRCGKTRFLQLLQLITPNAYATTNISPAALYRLIEQVHPTLLLDEAQSLSRRGSENSEVIREILNSGIDRDASIIRVGGANFNEIHKFRVYGPKVIALIGEVDSVLADRCLPIQMRRKTKQDQVERYLSRVVEPQAKTVHVALGKWARRKKNIVTRAHDNLELFDLQNDRMAELLAPLQAIVTVANPKSLYSLREYAMTLDRDDNVLPGVKLLASCRAILIPGKKFISTDDLLTKLLARTEEGWATWTYGRAVTARALSDLLRPFNILPKHNHDKTKRGYYRHDFLEAWSRYLCDEPSEPSEPSSKNGTDR